MITKAQAMEARHFEHVTLKNADGSRMRARRTGRTQTWKTRPSEFRIPIKHGLYEYGEITHVNASEWEVA